MILIKEQQLFLFVPGGVISSVHKHDTSIRLYRSIIQLPLHSKWSTLHLEVPATTPRNVRCWKHKHYGNASWFRQKLSRNALFAGKYNFKDTALGIQSILHGYGHNFAMWLAWNHAGVARSKGKREISYVCILQDKISVGVVGRVHEILCRNDILDMNISLV